MNIHLISGANIFRRKVSSKPALINKMRKSLETVFSEPKIISAPNYCHVQHDTLDRVISTLENTIDLDEETLLIGHSMGGVIGQKVLNTIDPEGKQKDHVHLFTMASPHTSFRIPYIPNAQKALDKIGMTDKKSPHLKTTFAGMFDYIVFPPASKVEEVPQKLILSDHGGFVYNPWIRAQVCRHISKVLKEQN